MTAHVLALRFVRLAQFSCLAVLLGTWLALTLSSPKPSTLTPRELAEREAFARYAAQELLLAPQALAIPAVVLLAAAMSVAVFRRPEAGAAGGGAMKPMKKDRTFGGRR